MNFLTRKSQAALAFLTLLAAQAHAAVPAAVTTALSDGQTDAVQIAGLILALVIAVAIFRHMRGAK